MVLVAQARKFITKNSIFFGLPRFPLCFVKRGEHIQRAFQILGEPNYFLIYTQSLSFSLSKYICIHRHTETHRHKERFVCVYTHMSLWVYWLRTHLRVYASTRACPRSPQQAALWTQDPRPHLTWDKSKRGNFGRANSDSALSLFLQMLHKWVSCVLHSFTSYQSKALRIKYTRIIFIWL